MSEGARAKVTEFIDPRDFANNDCDLTIMGLLTIKKTAEVELQDESSRNSDGISLRPRSPLAGASVKCAVSEDRLLSTIRQIVRDEIQLVLHQAKTESWIHRLNQKLRRMFL